MSSNEQSFFMEIMKPMVSAVVQNAIGNGQQQQQQQPVIQQAPWQPAQWNQRGQRGFNNSYGNSQNRGPSLSDRVDKLTEMIEKQQQPQNQQQQVAQPAMQPAAMQYGIPPVQMQQSPTCQPGFYAGAATLETPPPER